MKSQKTGHGRNQSSVVRRNLLALAAALALVGAAVSAHAAAPASPAAPAVQPPAGVVAPVAKPMDLQALLGQLTRTSASDPQLKPIGTDLAAKVSALSTSLGSGNTAAQSQLQSVVTSLLGNKGASSLGALQKLSQAKLTPEQTAIGKDVYHLGSAYVVQKNFGSLESSQTEVAEVVKSLRKGSLTESLPALKTIAQEAKLTPQQKEIVSTITDQYAPGMKRLGETFKGLPGFQKPAPAATEKQ